jgi:predicted neuraminidase
MKRIGTIILAMGLFLLAPLARADWTAVKRLTWTAGGSSVPSIAADSSGHIHLVWSDFTGGQSIYYKKSTDAGATWTVGKRLTGSASGSNNPAVVVDSSDNLHVVCEDYSAGNGEIYYKKSTDGGATWSTSKRLTWTSGGSFHPALAVSSGNLHLVWEDTTPGNSEIYYKKSTDEGATWSTSKRLAWTSGNTNYPAISVDPSGHLHVVWQDTTGNHEIYYTNSTDGGATWTKSKSISLTSGHSYRPALAVEPMPLGSRLHAFWTDDTPGNYEIYYAQSTDGGATWTKSKRITWTSGESTLPALAVDSSGHLHLVWVEVIANWEIYYKESTDSGATWTASQNLSRTSGSSDGPAIAADSSGYLHVVWSDDTPGNLEIYYRRGN